LETVSFELARVALTRVPGTVFEKFANTFLPSMFGVDFVPLGGTGDGGADGFQGVWTGKPGTFYQVSVELDHRSKIRRTIARLTEFGRTPKRLIYVTSRVIKAPDQEEELLSTELDVAVSIRHGEWIVSNINKDHSTITAYLTYLAPCVSDLSRVGMAKTASLISSAELRTAIVFLAQEIENRRGNIEFIDAVADSLIMWSLRDTEPDKGILKSRDDILHDIEGVLPQAKQFIRGVIDARLATLSSKAGEGGRHIRIYKKIGMYCLPYEVRSIVRDENARDEVLLDDVRQSFFERARNFVLANGMNADPQLVSEVALKAIEVGFSKEGMTFAQFLIDEDISGDVSSFADLVGEALSEKHLVGDVAIATFEATLHVVRSSMYEGRDCEKSLFNKWFRTYSLLFSLQIEPRIVEWFKSISSHFILMVGSDILIKSLSEAYVHQDSKSASKVLDLLTTSGSKLVLTEPVLEEVYTHVRAAHLEFKNYYAEIEPYITLPMVYSCDRILIRAYFYTKLRPADGVKPPGGWMSFINQICPPDKLATAEGKNFIKHYLIEKYKMEFISNQEIAKLLDSNEVAQLAEKMALSKEVDVLAFNDAKMALLVYAKRDEIREGHKPNPFGFKTWWLTHETKIRDVTGELIAQRGAKYMMRPEFVLNYVALSPKAEAVRNTYNSIFPTPIGISIGHSVREDVMHNFLKKIKSVSDLGEARMKAEASSLSNQIMGDFVKRYRRNM
jgi:hypothetical protein